MDEIRAHLPEEPNTFVGRERELVELHQLLYRTRALTLCGPGGIGKTRLALRLLASAAAEFPDGIWFVELADLRQHDLQQADLVVSRIASVIGITEEAGRPLLETLGDALRSRRLLLALDNCEHLLDACAQVSRHLLASAPGLRLLATSREPLSVAAETIWRVPPLSLAPAGPDPVAAAPGAERYEAVRLFADRAAASKPGFAVGPDNVAAITAICRALDGMPLAIELAAARVRALSVEQIVGRLDDRFGLLTAGDRSAAPRQRTLRAAIEWSYELLTEPERALFRRLAIFTGWSLEMAEQVCADEQIPAADVLGLTAALVDKSLVVLDPELLGQARYRMLDTIREYAALRLSQAAEAAVFRGRFRDYAMRTSEHNQALGMARIEAPWPARVDVFRRYDVDAGNVIQILNWCLEAGRRRGGAADLRRGEPVLDRVGDVRRGQRVAALVPGAGHDRGTGLGPGRGHRGTRAAHLVQRPRHRLGTGDRGAEAVPRGRRPVLGRGRAEPARRDRPAYRADRRGGGQRGRGPGHRAGSR